jgi:glycolate oxidase iron-sulfur subunit
MGFLWPFEDGRSVCAARCFATLRARGLQNMARPTPLELRAQTPETVPVHIDHERLMDCIHCGLCLSQCPTYAEEGLEADSPRGRVYLMRALAEGRSAPTPSLVRHLDLCLGCRACETACPSGVQYGHLLEGTRSYLRQNYRRPWRQRAVGKMVESIFAHPDRLEAALLPLRVLRRSGVLPLLHRTGVMRMLGCLGDMERMLPPMPPMRKRLHFPVTWPARGNQQAHVGLLTGCVMQVVQSPIHEATARVLTKAGCRVEAPREQVCCGALHAHGGGIREAKAFARKNIEVFEALQRQCGDLDAIIINAAGCGAALKEYAGWFKDDRQWAERAAAFAAKVRDVSEFLAQPHFKTRLAALMEQPSTHSSSPGTHPSNDAPRETIPNTVGGNTLQALGEITDEYSANQLEAAESRGAPGADEAVTGDRLLGVPHTRPEAATGGRRHTSRRSRRLTYHDACHLAHGQGVRAQPRALLDIVPDGEWVPLAESEMCCGSAGIYNITQPAMALRLLERKMKHIAATGARVVVTGNPGCMMQLRMGAEKFGVPVEVRHTVEILDAATRRK